MTTTTVSVCNSCLTEKKEGKKKEAATKKEHNPNIPPCSKLQLINCCYYITDPTTRITEEEENKLSKSHTLDKNCKV